MWARRRARCIAENHGAWAWYILGKQHLQNPGSRPILVNSKQWVEGFQLRVCRHHVWIDRARARTDDEGLQPRNTEALQMQETDEDLESISTMAFVPSRTMQPRHFQVVACQRAPTLESLVAFQGLGRRRCSPEPPFTMCRRKSYHNLADPCTVLCCLVKYSM